MSNLKQQTSSEEPDTIVSQVVKSLEMLIFSWWKTDTSALTIVICMPYHLLQLQIKTLLMGHVLTVIQENAG